MSTDAIPLADGAAYDYLLIELVHTLKSCNGLDDEAVKTKLETIGAHIGENITERLACERTTRFSDTLDAVKFICKDVWSAVWDKQVDNLRTNRRGVYVLHDNAFKPLLRLSSPEAVHLYLALPAGVIRGAFARLGMQAVVTPEMTHLPSCTFQVKLAKGA